MLLACDRSDGYTPGQEGFSQLDGSFLSRPAFMMVVIDSPPPPFSRPVIA
jgi:hypothetical protein